MGDHSDEEEVDVHEEKIQDKIEAPENEQIQVTKTQSTLPLDASPPTQAHSKRLGCSRALKANLRVTKDDAWLLLFHWGSIAVVIFFILFLVFGCYYSLPSPLTAAKAGFNKFSEDRARIYFNYILSNIGVRPYGTIKNHVDLPNYILSQLSRIQNETTVNGVQRITYQVRTHPGSVGIGPACSVPTCVWETMNNIIVTVLGKPGSEVEGALLISGHYDTVYMSEGATDNTMEISVMLELIEVLANQPALNCQIIFAFVNGEEIGLFGASDMATVDPLMARVAAFVNLDGTPGSKVLLFRTTGGWLDYAYSQVPRPLANVITNDLFEAGLVDSDTDWTMYQQVVPGVDLATFSHRQTYHTMKDTKISTGMLQFSGDNLLALTKYVGSQKFDLYQISQDKTRTVYFSFLNGGYAVYALSTSFALHITLAVVMLVTIVGVIGHRWWVFRRKELVGDAPIRPFNPIYNAATSFVFVLITFLVNLIGISIIGLVAGLYSPYFSNLSAAFGIFAFFPASMMLIILSQMAIRKWEKHLEYSLEVARQGWLWGTCIGWNIVLFFTIGTSQKYGSTYIIWMFAIFHWFSLLVHHAFWFFDVISDTKGHDYYEQLQSEDDAGLEIADGDVEVEMDPVSRPAAKVPTDPFALQAPQGGRDPHRRGWRGAISLPDWAWFVIWFICTFIPFLLWVDAFLPIMEVAASTLPAYYYAPIIGLSVWFAMNMFIPLSKRGHHYTLIAIVLVIWTIFTFFPFVIAGSAAYSPVAPIQIIPMQINDQMTFAPDLDYTYSIGLLSNDLWPGYRWLCPYGNTNCTASGFPKMPTPTTYVISPPHGATYAASISSPDAWVHTITFPTGTHTAYLNGIYTVVDPSLPIVTLLLGSWNATQNWTIEYSGTSNFVNVVSNWDDMTLIPAVPIIVKNLTSWTTFKGTGTGLAGISYSVPCQ